MKGGKPQVTETRLDPQTQSYVEQMRRMAQSYAGRPMPGLDPNVMGAVDWWKNAAGVGQSGLNALGGDVNAANQFMNPYFAQMNPIFERMRQSAGSRAQLAATSPFGIGAREGLATSNAMQGVNDMESQANIGAFNDAMGRAGQAANFGFGANQALFGAGDYLTNRQRNWDIGSQGLLNSSVGPYGQTQSTKTESNWFNNLLGTALSISSFIPGSPTFGWGAAAGQGINNTGQPLGYGDLPG